MNRRPSRGIVRGTLLLGAAAWLAVAAVPGALAQEDYEEAARLRDEIKQKELQIESLPAGNSAPEPAPDPPAAAPAAGRFA